MCLCACVGNGSLLRKWKQQQNRKQQKQNGQRQQRQRYSANIAQRQSAKNRERAMRQGGTRLISEVQTGAGRGERKRNIYAIHMYIHMYISPAFASYRISITFLLLIILQPSLVETKPHTPSTSSTHTHTHTMLPFTQTRARHTLFLLRERERERGEQNERTRIQQVPST